MLLSLPLENQAPLIFSARVILFIYFFASCLCLHVPPPPLFFKSQTEGLWPRNPALKMGTNSLSALLSALLGPSLITAPSFSLLVRSGHTHTHTHTHTQTYTHSCGTAPDAHLYFAAHWICLCNCIIIFYKPWICVASCHCVFRLSEVSESETEMTAEILLPMTAGQSHNWLVDVSLSITDVSIGAEHWSGGKGIHGNIYNSTESLKMSTASSFYLAKLNSL